jgi:hypothetical protein
MLGKDAVEIVATLQRTSPYGLYDNPITQGEGPGIDGDFPCRRPQPGIYQEPWVMQRCTGGNISVGHHHSRRAIPRKIRLQSRSQEFEVKIQIPQRKAVKKGLERMVYLLA